MSTNRPDKFTDCEFTDCVVYRCSRQQAMYLYVRSGLAQDALPEALLRHTGPLREVMRLQLGPRRRLARVDVMRVIEALKGPGFFLQMPPDGKVDVRLREPA